MSARVAELGLNWEGLAKQSGTGYETIRAIRKGDSRGRPLTRRAISVALQWTSDSLDRILNGGDPEVDPGTGAPSGESADRRAVIAGVRALYPGDTVAEAIMTQWGKPLEVRQRELDKWRATPGEQRALHSPRNEPGTITPIPQAAPYVPQRINGTNA